MEVVIVEDLAAAAKLAAGAIAALVQQKPQAVLGLATGSTPLPIYTELARKHREEGLSFAQVQGFALDEYVGLPPGDPQSYREVLRREFTDRVDVSPENVHAPDGNATDLSAACDAYEDEIQAAGGVDLQILGIGSNGHIGFNEPISSLASRTRIKTLVTQTRQDNARFFASIEEVPHHVLTQGLGTIMQARHLVLLAAGEMKAAAVRAAVEGPVSARCPASILQMHPRATVLLDPAAATQLELRDYYRDTWANKPSWQGI